MRQVAFKDPQLVLPRLYLPHESGDSGIVRDGLGMWLDGKDFTNTPATNPWFDRSGLGNNLSPSNFAYTPVSGSDGDGGVLFDGVDDYCGMADVSLSLNPLTVEFCFEISSLPASGWFVLLGGQIGSFTLGIDSASERIRATRYGVVDALPDTTILPLNRKIHCGVTYDFSAGSINYFINGARTVTGIFTPTWDENHKSNRIGSANNDWFFNGKIYSIRRYDRILSDFEILQNYNAER